VIGTTVAGGAVGMGVPWLVGTLMGPWAGGGAAGVRKMGVTVTGEGVGGGATIDGTGAGGVIGSGTTGSV